MRQYSGGSDRELASWYCDLYDPPMSIGDAVRSRRLELGLSQAEVAALAGVSRQLIGALEAGKHLPRIDAAISLARALGSDIETLFATSPPPVDVRSASRPADGALVRMGRVGDRVVTAAVRSGWDAADGVVVDGSVTPFDALPQGLVVAGCEPGLETLETLLRQRGVGALAVNASTADAVDCLAGGRVHAAVVHGAAGDLDPPGRVGEAVRYRLASWQVGLAAPADASDSLFATALDGFHEVIQREPGAAVQQAFRRRVGVDVPGPVVGSHLEAARLALITGNAAVTIEPAAYAVGARFLPLEMHRTELWVAGQWVGDRVVASGLDLLMSGRFQRQLRHVGGYDLDGFGDRAA